MGEADNQMATAQVTPAKRRANRRLALGLFLIAAAIFCLFVLMNWSH